MNQSTNQTQVAQQAHRIICTNEGSSFLVEAYGYDFHPSPQIQRNLVSNRWHFSSKQVSSRVIQYLRRFMIDTYTHPFPNLNWCSGDDVNPPLVDEVPWCFFCVLNHTFCCVFRIKPRKTHMSRFFSYDSLILKPSKTHMCFLNMVFTLWFMLKPMSMSWHWSQPRHHPRQAPWSWEGLPGQLEEKQNMLNATTRSLT